MGRVPLIVWDRLKAAAKVMDNAVVMHDLLQIREKRANCAPGPLRPLHDGV